MAVHYEVLAGETLMIAGPANVTIKGGEVPLIVDSIEEAQAAAPKVSGIAPDTVETGAADLTLVVTGSGFTAASVIIFGVNDEPTVFVSNTEISTVVKPSLFVPDTVPVSVRNGPAHSGAVDFTFTEPGAGTTARKRRAHVEQS